ncbi:Clp protease N-terminal domain-containing protein [Agromyces ramosus]|uniref:ATP-dependent Clp protease ATP-binding subunit ClpA n=1 Tax=Agromyces ramosus TaxID=33879 RepID=A0ABU0R4H5_9MICO|nr:Clp protease N-terminal domain-containing protein [Agromyces ramosus]MDQ0892975.1 ATP-dependent Clp protease ATP-binding subunit ClpA [Agromyces ramosus]
MPEQLHDDLGVGLKAVIVRSIDEAARRGAAKVEAEHLLLAIAGSGDVAADVLADVGLDYAGVEAALRGERERALRAAGIDPVAEERLHATGNSRPGWGASIRDGLQRGNYKARRDRSRAERERLAIADALIGVLRADLGTVPRALAYAGVDRAALVTRLEQL